MQHKNLIAIAKKIGVATAMATAAAVAGAGPTFTIDPSVFGPAPAPTFGSAPFQGDAFSTAGQTRALLGAGSGGTTGVGYLNFSAIQLNGSPVSIATSGMGVNWQVWAEFSFSMTLVAGSLGAPGSDYVLNSLTLNLYGESLAGPNAAFNPGSATANPMVTHSTDTKLLGTGSLLFGAAGINLGGGSSFNPAMMFSLVAPYGPSFFTAPTPFFPLAFASQTNDSGQITRSGNGMHLATGGTASFGRPVPEPMSLALVGVALLGAGVVGRRQIRK